MDAPPCGRARRGIGRPVLGTVDGQRRKLARQRLRGDFIRKIKA
ncbi:hypothetical protein BRI6_3314 [plant metagenome]|uniref:Uncharacterized protein n=1 Tax=plant metagenome TaxID=1297885 RepID=A0A484TYN6_9ZZZZ